jgi:hypothetical protein
MTGFDEEFALLKIVRADLSVKWKNIIANEELEAAQAFVASRMAPAVLYA